MLLRKVNILLFGVSLAWVAVAVCAHAQARPPALPAELDDREFWQVIVDVSEPGGHFEDENFVSNEAGYERVMRRLQDPVKPGGVYLGVGPEQNFTYEPYLFRSGSWKAFYENVMTLPLEGSGLFIRTFFGATARECRALRPVIRTPVLGSMAPLLSAYRRGDVKTQCDLVAWSR